jgi:hypothetical protein
MSDNKSPRTADIQNSFKLSEESQRKEGNTFRNEDSIFNNKKTKKKLIKSNEKKLNCKFKFYFKNNFSFITHNIFYLIKKFLTFLNF